MANYIVRRMLWNLLVIMVISMITFGLMHAVPGGPFDKEKALPEEIKKNLEERYHLDEPLPMQYARYISDILVPRISDVAPGTSLRDDYLFNIPVGEGRWFKWMNFGPSYASRSRTVNDIFRTAVAHFDPARRLALTAGLVIGLPLGILSALRQNTVWDYLGMSVAIFGVSVPVIVLGPIMVWIFGVSLKWLPPTGWGAKPPFILGIFPAHPTSRFFEHAIMPAIALGLASSAIIARLTRASLLQVTREDYIRTARAKGLKENMVIIRHAMRNS